MKNRRHKMRKRRASPTAYVVKHGPLAGNLAGRVFNLVFNTKSHREIRQDAPDYQYQIYTVRRCRDRDEMGQPYVEVIRVSPMYRNQRAYWDFIQTRFQSIGQIRGITFYDAWSQNKPTAPNFNSDPSVYRHGL